MRCSATVAINCCCEQTASQGPHYEQSSIGCALGGGTGAAGQNAGGVTNEQQIVFGCVDFYSAQCTYDANAASRGSYDAALREFATCAEVMPEPQGYCHGSLPSAAFLRNQGWTSSMFGRS